MSVEIRKMVLTDLPVLKNLFQLYLYDMSKYAEWGISNDGKFDFDQNIVRCVNAKKHIGLIYHF